MRTQGEARFTGQDFWQCREDAASMVLNSIAKQRAPIATSKAREFPFSTCVECGRKIPAGSMQKCQLSVGGFCSWHVPAAVREFMNDAILSNSQNRPEYSLKVSWVIGALILVSMLSGIAVGMWGNYAH